MLFKLETKLNFNQRHNMNCLLYSENAITMYPHGTYRAFLQGSLYIYIHLFHNWSDFKQNLNINVNTQLILSSVWFWNKTWIFMSINPWFPNLIFLFFIFLIAEFCWRFLVLCRSAITIIWFSVTFGFKTDSQAFKLFLFRFCPFFLQFWKHSFAMQCQFVSLINHSNPN